MVGNLHGLTKWLVWDWAAPQMGEPAVRDMCDRAARRMKVRLGAVPSNSKSQVDKLTALQLYWGVSAKATWRCAVQALQHMKTLQEEGVLQAISVTNWNAAQLRFALDAGVQICSNQVGRNISFQFRVAVVGLQVQWSLVDQRASLGEVAAICEANGIAVLAYGTVLFFLLPCWPIIMLQLCGGLMTNKHLGKPQPKPSNPSLVSPAWLCV